MAHGSQYCGKFSLHGRWAAEDYALSLDPWSHARHNRTLGHGAAARLALKQPASDEAETNP
jgi:hypothetical protein